MKEYVARIGCIFSFLWVCCMVGLSIGRLNDDGAAALHDTRVGRDLFVGLRLSVYGAAL